MVSDRRWVLHYGCGYPLVYRVRGDADSRLVWETSDLLRPRRLLRLGRATIEGETTVDGVPAIRVRIRNRYGDHYADLDPRTRLPLQFVYGDDEWKLRYRSKRRASLPRNFFSPRR